MKINIKQSLKNSTLVFMGAQLGIYAVTEDLLFALSAISSSAFWIGLKVSEK